MRSENERQPAWVASTCMSLRCILYTYLQYTYIYIYIYTYNLCIAGTRPVTKPLRSVRPERRRTFHTQFWLTAIYFPFCFWCVCFFRLRSSAEEGKRQHRRMEEEIGGKNHLRNAKPVNWKTTKNWALTALLSDLIWHSIFQFIWHSI